MASVGDKTAEGSLNGFFFIYVLKMFPNTILVSFNFTLVSKFSLRTLYYSLDTFLERS